MDDLGLRGVGPCAAGGVPWAELHSRRKSSVKGQRRWKIEHTLTGDVSSMLWRVRGTLVPWANSSVGSQYCPTPPRRSAVRPDPIRSWYVRVLGSPGQFSIEIGFRLYVLPESRWEDFSTMPWRVRETLVLWAKSYVGILSCPTPRCSAVRSDPTRS